MLWLDQLYRQIGCMLLEVKCFFFLIENFQLINQDTANSKLWKRCKESLAGGKQEFYARVSSEFKCIVCQDLVHRPITTPCAHIICEACLKLSYVAGFYKCPKCRSDLYETHTKKVCRNPAKNSAEISVKLRCRNFSNFFCRFFLQRFQWKK